MVYQAITNLTPTWGMYEDPILISEKPSFKINYSKILFINIHSNLKLIYANMACP